MISKIRFAIVLAPALIAVSSLHAQGKPTIPFHAEGDTSTVTPEAFLSVGLDQRIPEGKRLVVQHVSVFAQAADIKRESTQAVCILFGHGLDVNGRSRVISHFIAVSRVRDAESGDESLTGSHAMTMYLEPGPIVMECRAGPSGTKMSSVEARVTGELVAR